MADYFPLISRAVGGLSPNTREARESIYARAREALTRQLEGLDPPIADADLWRERNALEETIRRVEAQFPPAPRPEVRPPPAPAVPTAPTSSPPAPPRQPEPVSPAPVAASLPRRTDGAPPAMPTSQRPQPPGMSAPALRAPELRAPDMSASTRAGTAEPGDEPPRPITLEATEPDPSLEPDVGDGMVKRPKVVDRPVKKGIGKRRAIGVVVALPLMIGLGIAAYIMRDDPALYEPREPVPAGADPSTPQRKNDGRLDGNAPATPAAGPRPGPAQSVAPALPVASRAMFFEETANDPRGQQSDGQVIWRLETVAAGPGLPPETAARGSVAFPNARMALEIVFKRNRDAALPASHTIELVFKPEGDRPGVTEIGPIEARDQETQPGYQLRGAMVPVGVNLFLVGLERSELVTEKNVEAMRDQRYFAFQFRLSNSRVGAILIEKGSAGDRVFREAIEAWRR